MTESESLLSGNGVEHCPSSELSKMTFPKPWNTEEEKVTTDFTHNSRQERYQGLQKLSRV